MTDSPIQYNERDAMVEEILQNYYKEHEMAAGSEEEAKGRAALAATYEKLKK